METKDGLTLSRMLYIKETFDILYYSVAVNRVATYKELDNDLLRQAAFLTLVCAHVNIYAWG